MRAAVYERYGPPEVVSVQTVDDPTPGKGEVLVRVHSAAVTAADGRMRAARFPRGFAPFARMAFGVFRPRRPILGSPVSGVVEAIGPGVSTLAVGDAVCGMNGAGGGGHAELVALKASHLVPKPDTVSHDDAAGVLFGGTTAWSFLHEKADVKRGDRVLVIGGSGAVGSNAVQLAVLAGATVTAVTSARNAGLMRELGAESVVDYATRDMLKLGPQFDLVVDTVGVLTGRSGHELLAPGGQVLLIAADLFETVRARGPVKAGVAAERPADMTALLGLVGDGSLKVVIDEIFPLEQIVEAHRRVDSGRKVGNILVRP